MAAHKETISFFQGDEAYGRKGLSEHITGKYGVLSDKTEEGVRTIRLKIVDKTSFLQNVIKLTDLIAKSLKQADNKLFKAMLADTLRDYRDKDITAMIGDIEKGVKPVKTREACFKVIIGDGRRKNSHHIQFVN